MAIDKIESAGLATSTNQPGLRNIMINGDMSIAQRATSTASITGNGYHTVDRFQSLVNTLGTWTQSQSTDVPTGQGFAKSLKMDCTTADASPSAGDFCIIRQSIEGQNLQYLKKGTSSAESTTLSFWVKSAKTGTYIAELEDQDNGRQISQSYTISSADTWEKKTLTYAGDTTGAFNNDNLTSLRLKFWLGAGTTYTSGTLSTTWTSSTDANRAVGQVNLADSTSNEWYITGVQLEAGTSASDFEFLPVDVQTQRCERYYETSMDYGDYSQYQGQQPVAGMASSTYGAAVNTAGGRQFRTWKRAAPTVTLYHQDGTSGGIYRIHDAQKTTGNVAAHINQNGFLFASKTSGFNSGYYYYYGITVDAEL